LSCLPPAYSGDELFKSEAFRSRCAVCPQCHPHAIEQTERTNERRHKMATNDDVIAKIFGKMDTDNSGSICQAEMSAAFVVFDRDGE